MGWHWSRTVPHRAALSASLCPFPSQSCLRSSNHPQVLNLLSYGTPLPSHDSSSSCAGCPSSTARTSLCPHPWPPLTRMKNRALALGVGAASGIASERSSLPSLSCTSHSPPTLGYRLFPRRATRLTLRRL